MKLKFLLPLLCGVSLLASAQQVSPSGGNFVVEKNVVVPMRDGVTLRADLLRPSGGGAFPVLVYRTPYGKEPALEEYTTFRHAVEHGYAVVVQDVRGRYASDGEFRPYENEAATATTASSGQRANPGQMARLELSDFLIPGRCSG